MMGVVMFVLFVFVLHGGSQTVRAIVTALIYAILFIPLTYWADRLAYRTYLRRSGTRRPRASRRADSRLRPADRGA